MKIDSEPPDPIKLSKEIELVREKMREPPSLEAVMNLRDGVAVTSSQIQAMSKSLGPHAIMVDYIYIPSSSTAVINEFLCMIYKNGDLFSSDWVTPDLTPEKTELTHYAQLEQWVKEVYSESEPLSTDDADVYLAELTPLIEKVVEATDPGDTILLCPTGILFNIPFHAIPVDDKPLIERNPVVYTQSFTIIYICAFSALSQSPDTPANPIAIQALSDAESTLPTAPSMAFAPKIGAQLLSGPGLTKSSMLQAISQSSLIHFYGHVQFDETQGLDHYMAIRGIHTERVTARNIFDIRLRGGAHVNMIGCKSGRSEVRTNDDQFGLSTALLYAGAGSILSALWDIRMEDAHEFQEAFYDELMKQVSDDKHQDEEKSEGGSKERVLDLAKMLQKAMLRVSVDGNGGKRAPYHWAAFMLQGVWDALPIASLRSPQQHC